MRRAEVVFGMVGERGRRGLPIADVYRQLFNPNLYLLAYGNLAANHGILTPGSTAETADGMTQAKITHIIDQVRQERYRWTPVKRVYLETPHSMKKRPLGLPTWSDKLLQEVIRLILTAYYEPRFSSHSHGFRRGRGCHTALREIYHTWRGTVWFIEGDITGCFDHLDHAVLLDLLRPTFPDNRFLRLLEQLLNAGYLEEWRYHRTLSGVPQGGVVSPILANIYLNQLDQYIERILIPTYTRGEERQPNPVYGELRNAERRAWRAGRVAEAQQLHRQRLTQPSRDPVDPTYRRLRYVRYADDFLLGAVGPRVEAEAIKQQLSTFLRDTLKLTLSDDKTKITHGRTETAHFLGYELSVQHSPSQRTKRASDGAAMRSISGVIGLQVPTEVVRTKCAAYMRHGKPVHRSERLYDDVYSIIRRYAQEFQGLVDYYRLANNLHRLNRLRWVMETSLTKTLAHKLKCSVRAIYRRYRTTVPTAWGPRRVLQVTVPRPDKSPLVAQWGSTDLRRRLNAALDDQPPQIWNTRTELIERLLANTCELCGAHGTVEVHHIHALKDLQRPGRRAKPAWVQLMATRQRKTLAVCHSCHRAIHSDRQRG